MNGKKYVYAEPDLWIYNIFPHKGAEHAHSA